MNETHSQPKLIESNRPEERVEVLQNPQLLVPNHDKEALLNVLAVLVRNNTERTAYGYVSMKAGKAAILDEFTGMLTREYMPCKAVKGFVGQKIVYEKNVSTDMPLHGLRFAIAKRRATKKVLNYLK